MVSSRVPSSVSAGGRGVQPLMVGDEVDAPVDPHGDRWRVVGQCLPGERQRADHGLERALRPRHPRGGDGAPGLPQVRPGRGDGARAAPATPAARPWRTHSAARWPRPGRYRPPATPAPPAEPAASARSTPGARRSGGPPGCRYPRSRCTRAPGRADRSGRTSCRSVRESAASARARGTRAPGGDVMSSMVMKPRSQALTVASSWRPMFVGEVRIATTCDGSSWRLSGTSPLVSPVTHRSK